MGWKPFSIPQAPKLHKTNYINCIACQMLFSELPMHSKHNNFWCVLRAGEKWGTKCLGFTIRTQLPPPSLRILLATQPPTTDSRPIKYRTRKAHSPPSFPSPLHVEAKQGRVAIAGDSSMLMHSLLHEARNEIRTADLLCETDELQLRLSPRQMSKRGSSFCERTGR